MKKSKNLLKAILAVIIFEFFFATSFSQESIVDYLQGGLDDGNVLLEKYFEPFGGMLGTALNSGWYNTAKPHKLGGFDVTITANIAFTPVADRTFDIEELNLTYLQVATPGEGITPTIAGKNDVGPILNSGLLSFNAPKGVGLKVLPLPMIQAGIGLPLKSEIMFRYLPKFNVKTYSLGMWGLGIKHSIKESIPLLNKLPIDLSVMFAFTKLKTTQDINYTTGNLVNPSDISLLDNQQIAMTATSWTTNLVFSKKLSVVTLYGGLGYNGTKLDLDFEGNYPVNIANPVDPNYGLSAVIQDPFSLDLNEGGFRMNAGLRLKFGVITFHADYTKVKYPVMSAGFGVSFR